ncbi:Na+/H+ antiporter subunit E [Halalkalicoccus subterraneus]|uniref:Na+/H+ antiporter subunit E n=1 Tax=Halalkalicoccus subterraneus TaxID=2675002 RepID=UPI000EFC8992|nr:Na+/H+ antiporter subunit E [Halalkalicoccus subterraneus]
MKARTWLVVGVGLGVMFVFARDAQTTPVGVFGQFLTGVVVGLPIAYLFRRLYDDRIALGRLVTAVPYVGLYLITFTREVVVANLDVAYRVLAPGSTIHPEVILIPLRVQGDFGVTTIANTITITPGTVTQDYDEASNALYVHVIDGRDPESVVGTIRRWEDYALLIFDEELDPGSPAPEIVVDGGGSDGD